VVITFSIGRDRIRVEVADDGSTENSPRLTVAAEEAEGGRGLMIVRAVSADCGVIRTDRSTTVWCEIAIPGLGEEVEHIYETA
jgi:serine/threonine-protein kinase RsbW